MIKLIFFFLLSIMSSVSVAEAEKRIGQVYAQGCSGLVCELLGRPWKSADSFHKGGSIGAFPNYHGVSPGDIIGFPGHVGVYTGKSGEMFIDVPGPGKACRALKSGYGPQEVFKYSY